MNTLQDILPNISVQVQKNETVKKLSKEHIQSLLNVGKKASIDQKFEQLDFRIDEEEVIDLDLEKWSSDESNEDQ